MKQELRIRICYPLPEGAVLRLRTSLDNWQVDLEPESPGEDGLIEFHVSSEKPFFYFKPILHHHGEQTWAQGSNYLATMHGDRLTVFPYFYEDSRSRFSQLHAFPSTENERQHKIIVYMPPGYNENTLRHYPVVYMHDGQNLFFPEEAFAGVTWDVARTLEMLDATNVLDKTIVVGIYSGDRLHDFTGAGCQDYGRYLVEEVKPWVDSNFRTVPSEAAVMGSSLGGVVSLFLAWEWPHVFSKAACLSSTFGHAEDLFHRIASEPRRPNLKIYLDSGWPGDNFEVTRAMFDLLQSKGYVPDQEVKYLVFPAAQHNEADWANRLHIPFQFFFTRYAEFEQDGAARFELRSLPSAA